MQGVHSIETMGLVDGPGTRTIFFLQGCPLRCLLPQPDTQKAVGREAMTPERIVEIAGRYRSYHGEERRHLFRWRALLKAIVYACLKLLKQEGYNTCVDTSGFGNHATTPDPSLGRYLILDVKAFDAASFEELTAIDRFDLYLKFLASLDEHGFQADLGPPCDGPRLYR